MSVEEKALRLYTTEAVRVLAWTTDLIEATVRGDSGTWLVTIDPARSTCTCPNPRMCSHILAVDIWTLNQQRPTGEGEASSDPIGDPEGQPIKVHHTGGNDAS